MLKAIAVVVAVVTLSQAVPAMSLKTSAEQTIAAHQSRIDQSIALAVNGQ